MNLTEYKKDDVISVCRINLTEESIKKGDIFELRFNDKIICQYICTKEDNSAIEKLTLKRIFG